jgi:hypothetical protein
LLGDEDELEKWVEYGWLRREPTNTAEIKDLLGIVERSLADSRVEAVSTDLRFIAAFTTALGAAIRAVFGLDSEFKEDCQPTGNYQ